MANRPSTPLMATFILVVHIAALLRREDEGWRVVEARPYTFAPVPG